MLEIRDEQMAVFEQAALKNFEGEMVEHVKEFTPKHCEVLGERAVRTVVRLGIERAKEYGFTNRGPVRFYIELMFMFGSYFDTDPLILWATEILNDPAIVDQMVRAERLYEKLTDYVEKVAGPDNEFVKEALHRASQQRLEDLSVRAENFENEMIVRLAANYPQKCNYVGEPALRKLILLGLALANKHSVSKNTGKVLLIGLMFAQGHGFATDPQLPWIERTLTNPAITDPNKRIERLYSKTMTYLRHVLASLEKT
jgi:hypothetical protein